MRREADLLFSVVKTRLSVTKGWKDRKAATPTGMDVYTVAGDRIKVTVNVVTASEDRVSVKLTIDRGDSSHPATYKAIENAHRESNPLQGRVTWNPDSGNKESRIQVERAFSDRSVREHCDWIEKNALILREWADEAAAL